MQITIAVSTWSLHNLIGISYANGPADAPPYRKDDTWGPGDLDMLELPAALAARGYTACEICHFHIASLEAEYLSQLREAFVKAGVSVQTLLIDDGDISHAATRTRDIAWIKQWIIAAEVLGARYARVIAGKQKPSREALALSVQALRELVEFGHLHNVIVATENWLDLTPTPKEVHHILDQVPGLAFMADTGNWNGPSKHQDLASIFARAQLCHAKATIHGDFKVDQPDFNLCLKAAKSANYAGPMTLIFHDHGDEWQGLDAERRCILGA